MNDKKTTFKYKIENCVGSANLGTSLNLKELYKYLIRLQSELQSEIRDKSQDEDVAISGEYPFLVRHQPREFPGLILKLRFQVRASLLVFSSGNMVITGAKNKEELDKVAKIVVELFNRCGFKIKGTPKIKLQNIVASADLGKSINLELVASIMGENAYYEPEIFPGLIYKMEQPKVVLLLFRSGKVVCTGAKSEEMIEEALERIDQILREIDAYTEEE